MNRIRLIAVGNPERGDDGAGFAVAAALEGRIADSVDMLRCQGEGASLMLAWRGANRVLVVDAVRGGAVPGRIYRFDARARGLPPGLPTASSHAFGLWQAVELARVLGTLPPRLVIYGIAGVDFSPGAGLSPPVAAAVRRLARQLQATLGATAPSPERYVRRPRKRA